jgi:hypothetical protein
MVSFDPAQDLKLGFHKAINYRTSMLSYVHNPTVI